MVGDFAGGAALGQGIGDVDGAAKACSDAPVAVHGDVTELRQLLIVVAHLLPCLQQGAVVEFHFQGVLFLGDHIHLIGVDADFAEHSVGKLAQVLLVCHACLVVQAVHGAAAEDALPQECLGLHACLLGGIHDGGQPGGAVLGCHTEDQGAHVVGDLGFIDNVRHSVTLLGLVEEDGDDDTGDEYGAGGGAGKAGNQSLGDQVGSQDLVFLLVLSQELGGLVTEDIAGGEAACQRGQADGEGHGNAPAQLDTQRNAQQGDADDRQNQQDHKVTDDVQQHLDRNIGEGREHAQHDQDHDEAHAVGTLQRLGLQEAHLSSDDTQNQTHNVLGGNAAGGGVADFGNQNQQDDLDHGHGSALESSGHGGNQLGLFFLGTHGAVALENVGHGQFPGAVQLQDPGALFSQADIGQGEAGKALQNVHGNGEQPQVIIAHGRGSLLHHQGSHKAAGQGRRSNGHSLSIQNQLTNGQTYQTDAQHTGHGNEDGAPLGDEFLGGQHGAHVDNDDNHQERGQRGGNTADFQDVLGDNGPETNDCQNRADKHAGDKCLGGCGRCLTGYDAKQQQEPGLRLSGGVAGAQTVKYPECQNGNTGDHHGQRGFLLGQKRGFGFHLQDSLLYFIHTCMYI